jgi:histidine triad (HIT) family protein
MTAYDPQNIFAKILRAEIPCFKIYEDDRTFAFLDIMPRTHGHTLIIPKAPARTLIDIAPGDLAAVMLTAQKIAIAARSAFAADGITLMQFSEAAGGQEVFHLHVHIIPRHEGVAMKPPATIREDMAVLKANADKLISALG